MTYAAGAPPSWTVTLVCGASGIGKTAVAVRLASRYGVPLGEADDVYTALKALTTPEQQPLLHYWDSHPEAGSWSPVRIADLFLAAAESVQVAYRAVVADHVEFRTPVVLESDVLLPGLAAGFGEHVRAFVLEESDEDQIVANYLAREPQHGEQRHRARVSVEVTTAWSNGRAPPAYPSYRRGPGSTVWTGSTPHCAADSGGAFR